MSPLAAPPVKHNKDKENSGRPAKTARSQVGNALFVVIAWMYGMQRLVTDMRHAGMTLAVCTSPASIAFFTQQTVDSP